MDTEKLDKDSRYKINRAIIIILVVMSIFVAFFSVFGVQGIDAMAFYQMSFWNASPYLPRRVIALMWMASIVVIIAIMPIHIYMRPNGKAGVSIRKGKKTQDGITEINLLFSNKQRGDKARLKTVLFNWSVWFGDYDMEKNGDWSEVQGEKFELKKIDGLKMDASMWEARCRLSEYENRRMRRERESDRRDNYDYYPRPGNQRQIKREVMPDVMAGGE